jgi:hypothetical protein
MTIAALLETVIDVRETPGAAKLAAFDRQVKAVAKSSGGALTGLQAVGGAALLGLAAVAVHAIDSSVEKFVELASETRTLSRQLGLSAEETSKLGFAAEHVGISMSVLSRAAGLFEKNLVNATANSAKYGISLVDAEGHQKSFTTVLGEAADKYVELGGGIQGAALAQNVFGRGGKALIPLLELGAAGIHRLMEEAQQYGVVLSEQDLVAARKLQFAQRDLNEAWSGAAITLGREFVPIETLAVKGLTEFALVVERIPGPVKALVLGSVAAVGGLTGLGLVVGVVQKGLGTLFASVTSVTAALHGQAAATSEVTTMQFGFVGSAEAMATAEGQVAAASGEGSAALAAGGVAAIGFGAALADVLIPAGLLVGAVILLNKFVPHQRTSWDDAKDAVKRYGLASDEARKSIARVTAETVHGASARGAAITAIGQETTSLRALDDGQRALERSVPGATALLNEEATAHRRAALAALAQRDAEESLAGGLLGIEGAILGAKDSTLSLKSAEAQLRADRKSGHATALQLAQDAQAVAQAQFGTLQAQFSLRTAATSYAKTLEGPVAQAQAKVDDLTAKGKVGTDEYAQAVADLQAAQADLAPEQRRAIDLIRTLGEKAGLSKKFLNGLISDVFGYTKGIKGIPPTATTKVTTPGGAIARGLIQGLTQDVNAVPKKHDTKVQLPGILGAVGSVRGFTRDVYDIPTHHNTLVGANTGPGRSAVSSFVAFVNSQTATISVSARLRNVDLGQFGHGAHGLVFPGYQGGTLFSGPNGPFVAGEASYPTPLGTGDEIVGSHGVLPLGYDTIRELGAAIERERLRAVPAAAAERGRGSWPPVINVTVTGVAANASDLAEIVGREMGWQMMKAGLRRG